MVKLLRTEIESHKLGHKLVLVKREDTCCPKPGPPFSKVRGIVKHLQKLKDKGITTVGYTETSISQAGWGVAWVCAQIGLKAVIFDPQYKETPTVLKYHRMQWDKFDPDIIPIKAGMAKVNWNISRKLLREKYGDNAILLPLGLPFEETVTATAAEVVQTLEGIPGIASIVVNVGSGTICAGIIKAVIQSQAKIPIYGIMGRTGNVRQKKQKILDKTGELTVGFLNPVEFHLIDPGWEYTQKSEQPCPFPCHPYYDRKAWQWLVENIETVEEPTLFWNIGK